MRSDRLSSAKRKDGIFKTIRLAYDGSDHAHNALRMATDLSITYSCTIARALGSVSNAVAHGAECAWPTVV